MALTICKECNSEISTKAEACPKCGIKIKKHLSWPETIFGLLIGIGVIAWMASSSVNDKNAQLPTASCKKDDLKCIINEPAFSGFINASVYCQDSIERLANHDVKWTDEWPTLKFERARWTDKPGGLLTYVGDRVEFQNGFGAYTPMTYECDMGADGKTVLSVRAYEGRLPQ